MTVSEPYKSFDCGSVVCRPSTLPCGRFWSRRWCFQGGPPSTAYILPRGGGPGAALALWPPPLLPVGRWLMSLAWQADEKTRMFHFILLCQNQSP